MSSGENGTDNKEESKSPTVLIIGAGAAGLTAAYDLKRKNISFQVLEANSTIGGRLRKLEDFADFPIDLGAEWIHTDLSILETIIDDPQVDVNVATDVEDTRSHRTFEDGQWTNTPWEASTGHLYRFTNSTWFDFFNDFIVPHIENRIVCDCVVETINYASEQVCVRTRDGRSFSGSYVIVTVGIKMLQNESITFVPALSPSKRRAIQNVPFEAGMKVFIEFREQFYSNGGFSIEDSSAPDHGELFYWNESVIKKSKKNILGVYFYGEKALEYVKLDDEKLIERILSNLDHAFQGKASPLYVKHYTQNWTMNEPFVQGSYTSYRKGLKPMFTIAKPVNRRLFFAGEALPADGYDYGYAHGAALSGRFAVQQIQRVLSEQPLIFNARAFSVHLLSTLCCGWEHTLFFDESD